MIVRKYTNEDFYEIKEWYRSRGSEVKENLLPQIGFISPGIAAGFLMQTDTKCCILEPFIANPNTDIEDRDTALVVILDQLCNCAEELGYNVIYGFSTSPTMIQRALDQGFRITEVSTTVVKELNCLF